MIMTLISLFILSAPSQAALPPYYDRIKQIETVLDSQDVYNVLGGRQINKIETDGSLSFSLDIGSACVHNVTLEVVPPKTQPGKPVPVGATVYKVKAINTNCLP